MTNVASVTKPTALIGLYSVAPLAPAPLSCNPLLPRCYTELAHFLRRRAGDPWIASILMAGISESIHEHW